MKILLLAICSLLCSAFCYGQEVEAKANAHMLLSNDQGILTTELAWKIKGTTISGFGFCDFDLEGGHLCRASTNISQGPFVLTGEVLLVESEDLAPSFGPGLIVTKTPILEDIVRPLFKTIRVNYMLGSGIESESQWKMVFRTQDVSLGDGKLYASGVYRIRSDKPDMFQPQIWFAPDSSLWEFGGEYLNVGNNETFYLALKRGF